MNKKAIMVKFLVTILITILVFVPTVLFASKILGGNSQAEDNFVQFADKIEKFVAGEETKTGPEMLIMDENTVLLGFEKDTRVYYKNKPYKLGTMTGGGTSGEVKTIYSLHLVTYLYPKTACGGESCICLCKNPKQEVINKKGDTETRRASCGEMDCKKVVGLDFISGIKYDDKIGQFNIQKGFIFERKEHEYLAGFGTILRRNPLYLEKTADGKLIICRESPCDKFMDKILEDN